MFRFKIGSSSILILGSEDGLPYHIIPFMDVLN